MYQPLYLGPSWKINSKLPLPTFVSRDMTKKTHLCLICHLRHDRHLPVSTISVSLHMGKLDEGGILEGGEGEDSGPLVTVYSMAEWSTSECTISIFVCVVTFTPYVKIWLFRKCHTIIWISIHNQKWLNPLCWLVNVHHMLYWVYNIV